MSQFRLRTSSGDALGIPEDAEMALFLDEDGFMRMRTEVYVDSVDIGLMTSREPDSGPAPRDGGHADLRNQREGWLSVDTIEAVNRERSSVVSESDSNSFGGGWYEPDYPHLTELLIAAFDRFSVDVGLLNLAERVARDIVNERPGGLSGDSDIDAALLRVEDDQRLTVAMNPVGEDGLNNQSGEQVECNVDSRGNEASLAHDDSVSVGGDGVEVGAPASSTGSGASEPTEEVPAAVAPVSSGCAGCCGRCGSGAGAFSSPASDPAREVRRDGDD